MKNILLQLLVLIVAFIPIATHATVPPLELSRQSGTLQLAWTNHPLLHVESATNLSGTWATISAAASLTSNRLVLSISATNKNTFYRLVCGTNAPPYPVDGAGITPANSTIIVSNVSPSSYTFSAPPFVDPPSCDTGPITYQWTASPPIPSLGGVNSLSLTIPRASVGLGPVDGAYTLQFTATGSTGLNTDLSTTVTFLPEDAGPPPCVPFDLPPVINNVTLTVTPGVSTVISSSATTMMNGARTLTFSAPNIVDPHQCSSNGDPAPTIHWVINYNAFPGFSDAGITGYHAGQLSIVPNSLLNGSLSLELTVTSAISPYRSTTITYPINVTGSTLTTSIYNTCQADSGLCTNPNALPTAEIP